MRALLSPEDVVVTRFKLLSFGAMSVCGFFRNIGHGGELSSVMSHVGLQEEYEMLLVLLCNLEGEIWSQSVVCVLGVAVVVMGEVGG